MLKAKGKQGVAARTSCAPLCAEGSNASTIGGGGSTHRIGRRLVGRRRPASADRRGARPNLRVDLAIRRVREYTLNAIRLHRHHCLMDLHRRCCVASLRRALPPHPCHGATAVVAHYHLERGDGHSTRLWPVGAAGTAALSSRGGPIIIECGSCASIIFIASLAPVRPVGSGTPALCAARGTHPSDTCHAVSTGKPI